MNRAQFLKLLGALTLAPSAAKLSSLNAPTRALDSITIHTTSPTNYFAPNDLLRFDNGELMRITHMTSDTITVTRNQFRTPPAG